MHNYFTKIASVLLLAVALSLPATAAAPTLAQTGPEEFTATFDAGAVVSCIVFRMTVPTEEPNENFPDGHYAPRKCWILDPTDTTMTEDWTYIPPYDVDWEVYASIQYPQGGDYTFVESNRVAVHW